LSYFVTQELAVALSEPVDRHFHRPFTQTGQWIVNRNAVAYASDTAGGPHHTLLPQGVTLVENLDLEKSFSSF
jgi:hypothetical protein